MCSWTGLAGDFTAQRGPAARVWRESGSQGREARRGLAATSFRKMTTSTHPPTWWQLANRSRPPFAETEVRMASDGHCFTHSFFRSFSQQAFIESPLCAGQDRPRFCLGKLSSPGNRQARRFSGGDKGYKNTEGGVCSGSSLSRWSWKVTFERDPGDTRRPPLDTGEETGGLRPGGWARQAWQADAGTLNSILSSVRGR